MAMICICGICIPYSSLIPILVVLFKPIWDYISKYMGWDKKQKNSGDTPNQCATKTDSCCSASNPEYNSKGDEGGDKISDNSSKYFADTNSIYLQDEMNWTDIIQSESYTVCKFTATWCKPCKRMQPVFEELASTYKNIRFVTIDVDEHAELFESLGIVGIPHVNIYKAGVVIDYIKGENADGLKALLVKYSPS